MPILLALASDRRRIQEALLDYLRKNPALRDTILGMGSALDPAPRCYRQPFITDDHLALAYDWMMIGESLRSAMSRADGEVATQTEKPGIKRSA